MFQMLALTASSAFAGINFYINLAECKASRQMDPNTAVKHWQNIYGAAVPLCPALTVFAGINGIIGSFLLGWNPVWLVGGLLMLSNVPITGLFLMPINKQLGQTKDGEANDKSMDLIVRWNKLHTIRTALSMTATILFTLAP